MFLRCILRQRSLSEYRVTDAGFRDDGFKNIRFNWTNNYYSMIFFRKKFN